MEQIITDIINWPIGGQILGGVGAILSVIGAYQAIRLSIPRRKESILNMLKTENETLRRQRDQFKNDLDSVLQNLEASSAEEAVSIINGKNTEIQDLKHSRIERLREIAASNREKEKASSSGIELGTGAAEEIPREKLKTISANCNVDIELVQKIYTEADSMPDALKHLLFLKQQSMQNALEKRKHYEKLLEGPKRDSEKKQWAQDKGYWVTEHGKENMAVRWLESEIMKVEHDLSKNIIARQNKSS